MSYQERPPQSAETRDAYAVVERYLREEQNLYEETAKRFLEAIKPAVEKLRDKCAPQIMLADVTGTWQRADEYRTALELDLESGEIYSVMRSYHYEDEDSQGNFIGIGTFDVPSTKAKRVAGFREIVDHMNSILLTLNRALDAKEKGQFFWNIKGTKPAAASAAS